MGFPLTEAEHIEIAARIDGQVELIVAVAIRTPEAILTLPRPARHGNLLHVASKLGGGSGSEQDQGFLTNRGRFVNRVEGAQIALKSGQTDYVRAPGWDGEGCLFTEDLWNDPGINCAPEDKEEMRQVAREMAEEAKISYLKKVG